MAHSGELLHVDLAVIIADDDKMRAVGRLSRDIIEDITLNEDYCQKPLDIERNLPVLTGIVRRKYETGELHRLHGQPRGHSRQRQADRDRARRSGRAHSNRIAG
jgi:hypothetical protein